MQVGIFGGCFDPPHRGHLAVTEAALRTAGMDQIVVIPAAFASGQEPGILASATDRMNMCRLCFSSEPKCVISDIEAHRNEWTATVTTVERLKKQTYRHDKLTLIIGADKLPTLHHWQRAEELFELCDILVCPRGGIEVPEQIDRLRAFGARIRMLDVPAAPGASSKVQQSLRRYEAPAELIPPVLSYIAENWLYLDPAVLNVERLMTPKRWKHTLGVRQQAVWLAGVHGINVLEASLAAMLHDSAKCLPFEVMLSYAHEAGIQEATFLSSSAMLHGPVGAYIAKTQFGVENPDVLNAITYHTVGRAQMSPLEMCIFVADATEPGRDQYAGLKRLRKLSERSLEAAVLLSLNLTKEYVIKSGKAFNPLSDATARWITPRVPKDLLPLTVAQLH